MTTFLSPCVPDASVLIDFHVGGILNELFSLPRRWLLPDLAMAELRIPAPQTLRAFGLEVAEFSGEEVLAIFGLRADYPMLSLPDCASLFLARRESALLLTGDRLLRRVAADCFGLEVHGALWALDRLVETRRLSSAQAAHALRRMQEAGRRLPRAECERRLERWEK